ncbi:major facilitator superfamily domain-containing protein [Stachybotrys elegans]|uniref:Major facilitator superfamily domain-containing protein n=1 Tax=Stachybotrys elegans TaxID=80388 RepID=A0A8K0WVW3_9HYPO|nr:major facilitator superfamily domain-containing protein [Stachybotrys elegans]
MLLISDEPQKSPRQLSPASDDCDLEKHSPASAPPVQCQPQSDASLEPPTQSPTTHGPPQNGSADNYKPRTLKFWLIILSSFMSLFLVAIDRTILSTAIPNITDDFGSLGDIGWYGSAYMLTTAAFQLLFGRIFRFYDLRWTFLVCIAIFEVGSLLCGVAPNSISFIVGRAVSGVGSAGIMTGSMMVVISMVPLPKRPMIQSLFGFVFGFAAVVGPLIGGAFAREATWRWCFYINLPIGLVASACLFFFLKTPMKPSKTMPLIQHIMRLDPIGTVLFIPSMVCLVLALQWGGSTYAWGDWRIIVLFVIFGVTAIAFGIVQVKMPETATLPVRIITQRSVLAGAWFSLLLAGAMMLCIYYLPIWFQTTHGIDPVESGVYTLPLLVPLVIAGALSGITTQKTGYYVPAMMICPSLMMVGEGLMTTFTPESGSQQWIAFQFLVGFGLGFGMQTVGLACQTVLPMEDVPTGVAIGFFTQQLGGAVFVSVGQSILSTTLVSRLADLPNLDPDTIVNTGVTELMSLAGPEHSGLLTTAYNDACTTIFMVALILSGAQLVCACCMEWKSIKKGKLGAPGKPPAGPPAPTS